MGKEVSKLNMWQERLLESNTEYLKEVTKMDEREKLYNGDKTIKPITSAHKGKKGKATHIRNIIFENIESQVSSAIPKPKVTAVKKEDEPLAEIIETFLRNEIDRLPFEEINDLAERTVPIQGGVGFLVEWDNDKMTHDTVGCVNVTIIHPKQFAPQPGVYTDIDDMDWFILKIPTTKAAIKRKYGISVIHEGEQEPDIRTSDGKYSLSDEAVTEYIGFEKNESGGLNRYAWVCDIELEDIENYQARRQPVCKKCGRVKPLPGQIIGQKRDTEEEQREKREHEILSRAAGKIIAGKRAEAELLGEEYSDAFEEGEAKEPIKYNGGACPFCGSDEWTSREQEFEQVILPIKTRSGLEIAGMTPDFSNEGMAVMKPTMIPFYKPDSYPIILQKSVSVYGQLLGNSDVDQIRDQQNTINVLEKKIIDRLCKAGTRITLPDNAKLKTDPEDGERWFLESPADKAMIDVLEFSGNLQYELAYMANVYEEARQVLGITDSFQGRADRTATSGKAKEFSAAQAAGRLESKRIMKNAAYAAIYETMFKFWLAYSDEPRPIAYKNSRGETEYTEFNRYDFLKQDEDGAYYFEDRFLFSCDISEPLASNREAMWQETRMNLQTGAFGDPANIETLLLFWGKMEELHYPGAGSTKKFLEERQQREAAQAQQMRQMQLQQMQAQQAGAGQMQAGQGEEIPQEVLAKIDAQARAQAKKDAGIV